MKVEFLIETVHDLLECDQVDLALQLMTQNIHLSHTISFVDCYATVLYCNEEYQESLHWLQMNLKRILETKENELLLSSTYFQMGNCAIALGQQENAIDNYLECLNYVHTSDPIYIEIQRLIPNSWAV